MKKTVYVVKDSVTKNFANMFEAVNDESAIRQFEYGLKSYPFRQDTQLYRLGEFDDETGDFKHNLEFLKNYEEIINNEE